MAKSQIETTPARNRNGPAWFTDDIASVAAACPTCKEGLAQNDPQGQSIAAGYYYSILFMMSMPYIVLGTFISVAYYSVRRARQKQVDEQI